MHYAPIRAIVRATLATLVAGSSTLALAQPADNSAAKSAEARAAAVVAQMKPEEKTVLTHGVFAMPLFPGFVMPEGAVPGAGFISGIPRLGIPSLRETDASLGVAWLGGVRKDGATPLPSGLALASSWNPELMYRGGAMIGSEARAKGFNVLLAGGANLMRDPRNGRTFEYLSEDPLLTGILVGASIAGVQSNHIISTIKHFALNGQETGRNFIDARIADAPARESDLLAFQIGIERGNPGSVMCAYNRVNGPYACDSDWLLNKVLKRDWRYKGFVMSDWGAVPSLSAATNGLDQQSGAQLDPKVFFGEPLATAAATDPALAERRDDMNRRVLTAIFANGLDAHPATPGGKIDVEANSLVALEAAKQGIVLLRNERGTLPLTAAAKTIVVIGGYADSGVMSGGGSSQVDTVEGPAVKVPLGGEGPFAEFMAQHYHRSAPLKAITKLAKEAKVTFLKGEYISEAVTAARKADVAIVFATSWRAEGIDVPDLSLPHGQDELIAAVAAANPKTIVVLETGGPVAMPWLDKTAGVLAAWYPGGRGGEAIASILFGETNPSGRLPVTFPAGLDQLPRPKLDGLGEVQAGIFLAGPTDQKLSVNYDIEGSDVGYRWFARKNLKALFPFGHGLSYTTFATSGLAVRPDGATYTVRNTGAREGAVVTQLYMVSRNGQTRQRLVGFQRVDLAAGESRNVAVRFDPKVLADWVDGGWSIAPGSYAFALGDDAEHLRQTVTVRLPGKRWKD